MSRVIGGHNFTRRAALKLRRRFKTFVLCATLGLLPLTAYPRTASVVTRQEPPTGAKAQTTYAPLTPTPDGARLPDLSSLDIPLLIRESDRLGAAMHARLPEYTYVQARLSREFNQRGELVEHASVYEAYPVTIRGRHRHILSLISEDGAPVSPKRLKKERQRAAKEMETAERDRGLQPIGTPTALDEKYVTAGFGVSQAGDGVWVGVSQFLRQCRFGAPRYGRLGDRDVIVLNIQPPAGGASDLRERYLARMDGVIWIDVADKVVARLEAWPRHIATETAMPSLPPNAETLVYEQTRLPNGLWVPRRIRLNATGKAELFNGTDKDMTFEFSRYQRFNTEAKDLEQVRLNPKP